MKKCTYRITDPKGDIARQARKLLVLATVALLVIWPLPDCVQAAAGDLDPTFGNGGKVITDFFGSEDEGSAIVIQPDGKIVMAGTAFRNFIDNEFALARYNSNGSLDPTFGNGGKVTTAFVNQFSTISSRINALALQPDGKIIAVGEAFNNHIALARYNTDGSLDPTFGSGGQVTTRFSDLNFNEEERALAVALQPDGKIVTAGLRVALFLGLEFSDFQLVRYNTDGSLDLTFGTGGQVTTHLFGNFFANLSEARGIIIQPDGKIVAAGLAGNSADPNPFEFALARYNTDGSLDPTFGSGGQVITDFFGGLDIATAVVLQPDGKIVASGPATDSNGIVGFGIARYNANGNLDAGFGNGGKALTFPGGNNRASSASTLQPDGKIIVVGPANAIPFVPIGGFIIARYNSNGSQDASFGDGGKVITDFPGSGTQAKAVALQPDGKIVAAGTAFNDDIDGDFALARYDGAGFDICLQDDSNGNLLRFNPQTGDYQFSECRKGLTLTGRGSVRIRFCKIEFSASRPDHSITALANTCTNVGSASVKLFPSGRTLVISDRDMTNNTCACR